MGLTHRPDSPGHPWRVRLSVVDPDGTARRVSRSFATRREARAWLAAQEQAATTGGVVAPPRETLGHYLPRWLAHKAGQVRPRTLVRYRADCARIWTARLGAVYLDALTVGAVQGVLDELAAAGTLSPRSIRTARDTLRAALNTALRWELLGRNVAALAVPPHAIRPRPVVLDAAGARALLAAAPGARYGAVVALALLLGLRAGEVLGLRWPDVDVGAGTVRITQALARLPGQGLVLAPLKTPASARGLVLPPPAGAFLRAERAAQAARRLAAGPAWQNAHELVFTTGRGTPVSPQKLCPAFKRLLAVAGLPPMRFHDLRHSTATLLLAAGVDLKVVQSILGHTTLATTADLYAHVLPPAHAAAAATLGHLLAGD